MIKIWKYLLTLCLKLAVQFSLFMHPDQAQNTPSGIQGQEATAAAVIYVTGKKLTPTFHNQDKQTPRLFFRFGRSPIAIKQNPIGNMCRCCLRALTRNFCFLAEPDKRRKRVASENIWKDQNWWSFQLRDNCKQSRTACGKETPVKWFIISKLKRSAVEKGSWMCVCEIHACPKRRFRLAARVLVKLVVCS